VFDPAAYEVYDDYRFASHRLLRCDIAPDASYFVRQNFRLGKGGLLWDAALLLSRYLYRYPSKASSGERFPPESPRPTCVELGAGVGLPGIVAASIGYVTVLTDIRKLVPLMDANIELQQRVRQAGRATTDNEPFDCTAAELSWGECDQMESALKSLHRRARGGGSDEGGSDIDACSPTSPPSLILCSDLVYQEEDFGLLVDTLDRLCRPSPDASTPATRIILTMRIRFVDKYETFMALLRERFTVDEVSRDVVQGLHPNADLHLFEIRRRCGLRR